MLLLCKNDFVLHFEHIDAFLLKTETRMFLTLSCAADHADLNVNMVFKVIWKPNNTLSVEMLHWLRIKEKMELSIVLENHWLCSRGRGGTQKGNE